MAKTENTKMTVGLDNDSKRILRNLTKAVDRLARSRWDETEGRSGVKRLEEPAEGGYVAGEISEEELAEIKRKRPEMYHRGEIDWVRPVVY